jgi:hypothetical protein
MEIDLPGGGAVRKLGDLAALIPCRRVGGDMAEYDECIIEPLGRVYIDVQQTDLEYKTRHRLGVQDTYPISILI